MTMTKQSLIADFEAGRAAYERKLAGLSNALLGHGYVVRCAGIYVRFDIKDGVATKSHTAPLLAAPRFTKQDAETLAAAIKNGNGQHGEAVHITTALRDEIASITNILATLQGA